MLVNGCIRCEPPRCCPSSQTRPQGLNREGGSRRYALSVFALPGTRLRGEDVDVAQRMSSDYGHIPPLRLSVLPPRFSSRLFRVPVHIALPLASAPPLSSLRFLPIALRPCRPCQPLYFLPLASSSYRRSSNSHHLPCTRHSRSILPLKAQKWNCGVRRRVVAAATGRRERTKSRRSDRYRARREWREMRGKGRRSQYRVTVSGVGAS
ncbi:hypothetical protein DFH06DRAFT_379449 [Mycena polygramma]|nr:hypothetical protein DFH06DRAFT_379449 [Mycena polygramma]